MQEASKQQTEPQETEENIPENDIAKQRSETAEKLGALMSILNITEAYYIDDYNDVDYFPVISECTKSLFADGRLIDIQDMFGDSLNLDVPDDEILGNELHKLWEEFNEQQKREVILKVHSLNEDEFNHLDYDRTSELQRSFPDGSLKLVSPDKWPDLLNELSQKLGNGEKTLILFDQDLTKAKDERFKNGTTKGQNLILEIKGSNIKDNVFCALITHLIQDTSKELEARDSIINDLDNKLERSDFLALTKERIQTPELLCDGIKKALLNGYFEEIKDKSIDIITKAYDNASKAFQQLDTYDFDHTILRSSYGEGVWEASTLFRITENIYEQEVRKLMIEKGYAKNINPILKQSKLISDIKFEITPGLNPYKTKYKLRHQDLYDAGEEINRLHLPIENGDIFQVTEGTGRNKYFILIGQECDLMMRTKPLGSRSSVNAVGSLVEIKSYTIEDLKAKIDGSNRSGTPNHFYANKFKLDYFRSGTTDVGVALFTEGHTVNLDMLDLCVFQNDGKSILDLNTPFDTDLVNSAWQHRYNKLIAKFKKDADNLDIMLAQVNSLRNQEKTLIKTKIYPKLSLTGSLGKQSNYERRRFDFGIKRAMRLKPSGAKYLLERYYKHLSRTAEPHDFAN